MTETNPPRGETSEFTALCIAAQCLAYRTPGTCWADWLGFLQMAGLLANGDEKMMDLMLGTPPGNTQPMTAANRLPASRTD